MCSLKVAKCEFFVVSQLKERIVCACTCIFVRVLDGMHYLNTHFHCNDKIAIYKLRIYCKTRPTVCQRKLYLEKNQLSCLGWDLNPLHSTF